MSKNIKLSPKHGVNPSMQLCFFCGECKGIALMGKINKKDPEAPRECVMDLEPCDKCKEKYKNATLVVEVTINKNDPLDNFKPTGRYVAVKKEAINDDNVKKSPVALCISDDFKEIFKDILKEN